MGVAALVLGIIALVLSFFGGVGGIILGIAAVVLGVLGRRAAERDGLPTGSATGGLVTGIIAIVLGAAIFAACVKCASGCAEVARGIAKLGEARGTMEQISRLQMSYYQAERVDEQGNLLPKTFVSTRPVPAKVPCQDKPVMVTPEEWRAAGWDAIHFTPAGPMKFQFESVARGEGKNARVDVIVRADPRCDGTFADLRQRVAVDAEGRPFMVQSPFAPPPGQRGQRRGLRRGAVPGPEPVAPEPGDEDEPPAPGDVAPPPDDQAAPGAPPARKTPPAPAPAAGGKGQAAPAAPAPAPR